MEYRLEELSALELADLIKSKKVTPTEVIKYFIDRIENRNPSLNALVYTKYEYALGEAKKLEEKIKNNEELQAFSGVPFVLKDFLDSKKGWTSSHGGVKSLIKIDAIDSEFCKAMEALGGIAIGKSNAPSFGFRATTYNELYGFTNNPFDTRYNSGGSSGGTAAAIADGLVPIGEGGDAGGSIRCPASWCNVFGFKASAGFIPNYCRPDAWAATHPFCCNGGLTKTVTDAAILLNEMAKYEPRDPLSVSTNGVDFVKEMNKGIKNLRIAYTLDFDLFPLDEQVKKVFLDAIEKLKIKGTCIDLVHFKFKRSLKEYSDMWCKSISFDTAIEMQLMKEKGLDLVGEHAEELPEQFIYWNKKASEINAMDLYDFNLARTEVLDAFQDVFDNYDIILSPVTACPPVLNKEKGIGPSEINGVKVDPLIGFAETFLVNFIGNPAASVPAGLVEGKLPVGLQVIGRRYHDGDVLAVSKVFEEINPWRKNYKIPFTRKLK